MAFDRKKINGNTYSWGSLIAKAQGDEFSGLVELSYSQKRERAKVYGTGRHQAPRGRTRGKYSAEGKIKVVRGTAAAFINFLSTKATDGISYGDVVFQFVAQYVEDDETPMLVELVDCVVADESVTDSEGVEALNDEFTLDIMRIRKNGKTMYDSSRG